MPVETPVAQPEGTEPGIMPPEPRFTPSGDTVQDRLTGLVWTQDAAPAEFPLTWTEALDAVRDMNHENAFGHSDWRLPNRRELFSLVSHVQINPALAADHPFGNVFTGYYWSATTCARLPNQAWYVHLGGARLFKGMKHGSYMVWPVRGDSVNVYRTGQTRCFDADGTPVPCDGTGQDGDRRTGLPWPSPRFETGGETVHDRLTGLTWLRNADLTGKPLTWHDAVETVRQMNTERTHGHADWRLPDIRELESLTDMDAHSPALPREHPFTNVQPFYWSGTTSMYDTTYAWTLYLIDGPVGVGYKERPEFYLWPVRGHLSQT